MTSDRIKTKNSKIHYTQKRIQHFGTEHRSPLGKFTSLSITPLKLSLQELGAQISREKKEELQILHLLRLYRKKNPRKIFKFKKVEKNYIHVSFRGQQAVTESFQIFKRRCGYRPSLILKILKSISLIPVNKNLVQAKA